MHYEEIQNKLNKADDSLKSQFGLRFLFVSMLSLSLTLAACRFLVSSNESILLASLALSTLSIIIGLGFIALSIFVAVSVALTDENPVFQKINLRRSFNLFVIGTIFLTPGVVIIAMSWQSGTS